MELNLGLKTSSINVFVVKHIDTMLFVHDPISVALRDRAPIEKFEELIDEGACINVYVPNAPWLGVQYNMRMFEWTTPLLNAVSFNRLDVAELLLDNGADVFVKGIMQPFVSCAITIEMFNLLISRGADPFEIGIQDDDPYYYSALTNVVVNGYVNILRRILNINEYSLDHIDYCLEIRENEEVHQILTEFRDKM